MPGLLGFQVPDAAFALRGSVGLSVGKPGQLGKQQDKEPGRQAFRSAAFGSWELRGSLVEVTAPPHHPDNHPDTTPPGSLRKHGADKKYTRYRAPRSTQHLRFFGPILHCQGLGY